MSSLKNCCKRANHAGENEVEVEDESITDDGSPLVDGGGGASAMHDDDGHSSSMDTKR